DDGGRGACDPVLRERSVVRPRGAGEPGAQISSDLVGEGGPGDPAATEVELVSCVRRREMYEFVGEFIVVLQRMHERGLINAVSDSLFEGQPQEFDVAHGEGVVVAGAGDEVVTEVSAGFGGERDRVDREVELLE